MPGSKDDPVILDIFQEIRNVGWLNLRYLVYVPISTVPLSRLHTSAGTLDFTGFNPIVPVPNTLEEFKALIDVTYLVAFHPTEFALVIPMFCFGRFMVENLSIDPVSVSTEGSPNFDESFSIDQPLRRSKFEPLDVQLFDAGFIFSAIRNQYGLS